MKIIHVSDTHIGCEIPVKYREIRRQDFLNAFKQVVEYAIREKVDLIIHSGDFLDDYFKFSSNLTISLFELMLELKNNGIPLVFIKGNHDSKGQKNNTLELLKKLGLAIEAGKVPYVYKDIYVYGISEPPNLSGEELRQFYISYLKNYKIDKSGFTIFMFHGATNIFPELLEYEYDKYRILPNDILPKADYYAFGHFHQKNLKNVDGTIYAIPGSTERTEISKIEENSRKGFYLIEDNNIKFIEIKVRPIFLYETSLEREEDINKIKEIVLTKSKETLIKLRIRYNKSLYSVLKNFIDNLIESGYYIIDELFVKEVSEIFEESSINFEDLLNNRFIVNKEEIIDLFNKLKGLFEEYYSEDEKNYIERVKEMFYKEII